MTTVSRPLLRVEHLSKTFPGRQGPGRRLAAGRSRRDRGGGRAQRVGEVDAGQDPGGHPLSPTPGRRSTGAQRAALHPPGSRPGRHADDGREPGARTSRPRARSAGPSDGAAPSAATPTQLIARFGGIFDVRCPVDELSPAERTIVAIARALDGWTHSDNVLVLDEPTAALHGDEVEQAVRRGPPGRRRRRRRHLHLPPARRGARARRPRRRACATGALVADEPRGGFDHDAAGRADRRRARSRSSRRSRPPATEATPVLAVARPRRSARSTTSTSTSAGRDPRRQRAARLRPRADRRRSSSAPAAASRGLSRVGGTYRAGRLDPRRRSPPGSRYVPADRRRGGAVMDMSVRENLTLPTLAPAAAPLRLDRHARRAGRDRTAGSTRGRAAPRRPGAAAAPAQRRQPAEGRARQVAAHTSRGCCCSTSRPRASTSAPRRRSTS